MVRFRKWWPAGRLALAAVFALAALAAEIPAGTELSLRLKSKVSTATSRTGDAVEAILIAPVVAGGSFVLPAGALVKGTVSHVKPSPGPDDRAELGLKFTSLEAGSSKLNLSGQMADVENARESVDATSGLILGILASQTISARLESGIGRVADKYAGLASVLEGVRGGVMGRTVGEITYEPGVEFGYKLTAPLKVDKPPADAAPKLEPVADEDALLAAVQKQPFRTMSETPSKPSDITNLMFIGAEEQLRGIFTDAGWSTAAELSAQSKLETFRAIAELRSYKEAPVSILLLDGKPPDLVFQKQNNTFAARHHLRIWRRENNVYVCAATHDIGIDFSPENRTFIHKIDSNIDAERAKVVNDLLLTGRVKSLALVDRPEVPTNGSNATGDQLLTDGRMAVLILK